MSWRVAASLDVLLAEIDDHAPDRNRASDGSIGDAAHATRSSDHNPWVKVGATGVVRARDFTHDPAGGLDCQVLADRLADMIRTGAHPALGDGAYIIWRSRIFSRSRVDEGWRWYGDWSSGRNPHDKHLHLSVAYLAAGFDSTAPWGVFQPEDDMFTDEDRKLLRNIENDVDRLARQHKRIETRLSPDAAIRTKLNTLIRQGKATRGDLEELATELDAIAAEVTDDDTKAAKRR